MNNLLSYFGLVDVKISAYEKDLPVTWYSKRKDRFLVFSQTVANEK
jgi:hypothetical protein